MGACGGRQAQAVEDEIIYSGGTGNRQEAKETFDKRRYVDSPIIL